MTAAELRRQLRLPVVAAPMFLVSGPELVIAACKAGVVGSFPTMNARTPAILEQWLVRIERELGEARQAGPTIPVAPYAINLVVQGAGSPRFVADLALIERFKPAIVITSVGQPGAVVERIHAYGGLVFHDVTTLRHASKAAKQGVDGLILLTAGAGGHTGSANPFAFVPQVRRQFAGSILLAGSISDGRSIHAAEALGADFAYIGTRFAASQESMASDDYKALLVSQQMADVVTTDRISGMNATFLRGSITRVGLDPDDLPITAGFLHPTIPAGLKPWRDIWSGGHGVGAIDDLPPVAELVERFAIEYRSANARHPTSPEIPTPL
ncbi:NAD(P)H-dependent flavin oxidoreductase [Sphingopyxis granuli]|jgi:nitronate monooxygenase|uniref:NAD(P)H-dependent flavin oxidoreductase n=1 Tax=Sphingopyxis granuli TaxID=267128 RepID=UPI001BAE92A3|nr:nitronate monooxygenase [Sphingopyxis granuli]QUM74029.1 nitronate monooxygenase [Sphingopyxis granuli]